MGTLLRVSGRGLFWLEDSLLNGSAFIMFVIMILVVADVGLRYVFNSPIRWSYPLISQFLIVYVFFLAVADTLRRSQHIIIEFLVINLAIRKRSVAEFLGYIPSLFVFVVIFWLGVERTWMQYVNDDVKIDSLEWPSWIGTLALPIGIGAMLLRVAVRMVALAVRIADPETDVTEAYGKVESEEALALTEADLAATGK